MEHKNNSAAYVSDDNQDKLNLDGHDTDEIDDDESDEIPCSEMKRIPCVWKNLMTKWVRSKR